MIALINTNRMSPPVGPIGLDYIAGSVKKAGIDVDVVDLCLADDPAETLNKYLTGHKPELIGITFRNVDDCFWPDAEWFLPALAETVESIRNQSSTPIVLGGVGFSIFPKQVVQYTGVDFGIRGDGEQAIVSLTNELQGLKRFERVPGLIWHRNGRVCSNQPAWPKPLVLPYGRDFIDNVEYFKRGGQCGLETKRGCNRNCIYCADPLAKGTTLRLRDPAQVADEFEALAAKGIDVLHLCDSEFNIPPDHALAVCKELIKRSLEQKIRWYTYMATVPFDAELAETMSRAGCVGINFTGDSACDSMLKTYCQPHRKEDIASAIHLCRANGITVMIDLLFGGPGETPDTVKETVEFIKQANPDCAGAALGIRIYPGTRIAEIVAKEKMPAKNPNICRNYDGPVDLLKPTFYISQALGPRPDKLLKDLIGSDKRFFLSTDRALPQADSIDSTANYNYNDNTVLVEAIRKGARGAYWDILRKLRRSRND